MVLIRKTINKSDSWTVRGVMRPLVLSTGALFSVSVHAAQLADTPGLTELQSTTGAAVQAVCGGLIDRGFRPDPNPKTAEQDLFNQCSAMVQTSNENQGDGPTGNSLGLDNPELGGALQNVATEELGTPSRIAMSTLSGQVAQINTHLFDVHKISRNLGGGGGGDDEEGSLLANRLSLFVNGVGGFGDIKSTDRENASDFYTAGVVIGLDYRFTDNFVSGVAFGYTHMDSDFQQNINVSGGGVDADVYNLSAFASYDIGDFYVDGAFTYGWSGYDINRGVVVLDNSGGTSTGGANRVATSNPDGQQYSVGLGTGYNFHYKAFNINPYLRFDYFHANVDSYNESGAFGLNLAVEQQTFQSFQSLLGLQLAYAFSHSYGVFIPQFNTGWYHEFLNDSRAINARYTSDPSNLLLTAFTDNPDRDYATVGVGFSNVFAGGTQIFFNYQALLGYSNINSHGFTGGVRFEF